ncbi:tetratricopeptide repeat protein [Nocardia sp. JMUB6875]|uniref:tetratricopeptide repeat protein n=1 Tax=Nocardia sp. JMUB6875 TaxID=3158170 RepID=UPI0032E7BC25
MTATLPPDPVTLVGRDDDLRRILAAAAPGRVLSIHNEHSGSGKTALATRAAHRLKLDYPDGQYFVKLHANTHGQPRATPSDVLSDLLIGLGVDPRCVPDTVDDCRRLWRHRLADKQILLVLDDALDFATIEPLLPHSETCLTLVTSRQYLFTHGGAFPLELRGLTEHDAIDLLTGLSHQRPVTRQDGRAATKIVRSCGYLPLTIKVSAGRLARHPDQAFTGQANKLATTTKQLAIRHIKDPSTFAVFTLSYDDLTSDRQRLFRRLSLNPGPDFDAYAAAVLAGLDHATAARELSALCTDHLIEETSEGRYRLHDRLLEFAYSRTSDEPAPDITSVVTRLLDYYQHSAASADRMLARYIRPSGPSYPAPSADIPVRTFETPKDALTWMRAERDNLLACLEYAAARDPARMVALTGVMAMLLYQDGPLPLAVQLHERATKTARIRGDSLEEADGLVHLGAVRTLTGHYSHAASVLERAVKIYDAKHDRRGQANALDHIGIVRRLARDYGPAGEAFEQARDLFQELEDRLGEANALNDLGVVRWLTWDYREAETMQARALRLYTEAENPRGKANALTDLGIVRWVAGDYEQVGTLLEQALAMYEELAVVRWEANAVTDLGVVRRLNGDYPKVTELLWAALALNEKIEDRIGIASAYNNLGIVHLVIGNDVKADELYNKSLALYRELGYRHGEADALNDLGTLRCLTADLEEADALHRQALDLYNALGDRYGKADALCNRGTVLCLAGEYQRADTLFREALGLFRALGELLGEAKARNGIGKVLLETRETRRAMAEFTNARDICDKIGTRLEYARSLELIGRCNAEQGDATAAIADLRQAVDIYRHLGVREFAFAAVFLTKLTTARGKTPVADSSSTRQALDLNEAIEFFRYALFTADHTHPAMTTALKNLGDALSVRSRYSGSLADLDTAILLFRQAAQTAHVNPEAQAACLTKLAANLRIRSARAGSEADRDEANQLRQHMADTKGTVHFDDGPQGRQADTPNPREQTVPPDWISAHVEYLEDEPALAGHPFRVAVWLEAAETLAPVPELVALRVVLDAPPSVIAPVTRRTRMGSDRRTEPVEFEVVPTLSGSLPMLFRFYRELDNHPVLEIRSGLLVGYEEATR